MDIRRDTTPDPGGGHPPGTDGTPEVDTGGGHVPEGQDTGHLRIAGETPDMSIGTSDGTQGHVQGDTPPDTGVPSPDRADGFLTALALLAVIAAVAFTASRVVPYDVKAVIFDGALIVLAWLLWGPRRRVYLRWRAEAAAGES